MMLQIAGKYHKVFGEEKYENMKIWKGNARPEFNMWTMKKGVLRKLQIHKTITQHKNQPLWPHTVTNGKTFQTLLSNAGSDNER